MHIQDKNKNKRLLLVLIVVCIFMQVGISPHIAFLSAHANFALIFTVCMAYSRSGSSAVVSAFLSGILYDLLVNGPVGLMAFELVIVVLVIGGSERGRFGEKSSTLIKTFALTSFCVAMFYGVVLLFLGHIESFVDMTFYRAIPEVVLDTIAFLPFVMILTYRQSKQNTTFRSSYTNPGGLSSKPIKRKRQFFKSKSKTQLKSR